MADEVTELQQPKDAAAGPQETIARKSFSLPTVKSFTGKMQYRIDGPSEAMIGTRILALRGEKLVKVDRVLRGEVVYIDKLARGAALAVSGQFAHVAWDSDLGQPEEFRPPKKDVPAAPITKEHVPTDGEE